MAAATAGLILFLLAPTMAQASPEDTANAISREIMSPYCPGVTLHDCPSAEATRMRERIAGWAESGWSKDRILAHLEAQWGDIIRGTPRTDGAGLIAWLLPVLAILVGAVAVVLAARAWSERRGQAASAPPLSDSDRSRLEKELAQLRSEV
ncbi:MAG: cytochrome c-type biogenesis protein CcmH [Actinomycetota bacterium]|nr:cytochrome c-type biogenesis protein CcmH [Actinomycetota bacterium]